MHAKPKYLRRKAEVREPIPRILIVCEGEKTEVSYFKGFRLTNVKVYLHGIGANTRSLVESTREISDEDGPYDQVWCVFDRDSFPLTDFNAALQQARTYGYNVAYSNESFELWYCLHFNYYNSALARQDYVQRLSELLGIKYDKSDRRMYERLKDKQTIAIQNAKTLLASHGRATPAEANPSTTVHLLVECLNKFHLSLSRP